MADYILVVGAKDQERFRRFRTGYDRDIIKSIEHLRNADNIWALGPSTDLDLWSKIQKSDRIFFAEIGLPFSHYGIVSEKITNQTHAMKIWGDSPRIREHRRLILFSAICNMDMPFHKLCRKGGVNPSNMFTNIYPTKNKISEISSGIAQQAMVGVVITTHDDTVDKRSEVVTRFIRDTKKVKELKSIYEDKCQVCGHTIVISKDSRYSEVHHIHPLKDGGDDNFDNMIVLCPTHHVEFDYKIIGIHDDKETIIDKNGGIIGTISMKKNHKLSEKNIRFHLAGMSTS